MSLFQEKEDQDFAKALIEYMSIIQRISLRRKERNEPPVDDGRPKRRNKKRRRRGRRGQRGARRSELTRVADEKRVVIYYTLRQKIQPIISAINISKKFNQ